jgi:hypothetical protein
MFQPNNAIFRVMYTYEVVALVHLYIFLTVSLFVPFSDKIIDEIVGFYWNR